MDSRVAHNLPPVAVKYDFVIVNHELFEDFEAFKSKEELHDTSLLERNDLLECWLK